MLTGKQVQLLRMCSATCISSSFAVDDFWLALIVTNQSQQSLALWCKCLRICVSNWNIKRTETSRSPSPSFRCALVWHFFFADLYVFFCAISGWGSSYFLSVLLSSYSITKHIFMTMNTTCGHILFLFISRANQQLTCVRSTAINDETESF